MDKILKVGVTLIFLCARASAAVQSDNLVADPVQAFITKNFSNECSGNKDLKIARIIADFNNDGLKDIALSSPPCLWGNAGGPWEIYLATKEGKYILLDTLFFHPLAISIKPLKNGVARISIYVRGGGGSGSLLEFTISKGTIKKIKERQIRPDTEGSEDKKEYDFLFGYLRENPISEYSNFSDYNKDNRLVWKKGY